MQKEKWEEFQIDTNHFYEVMEQRVHQSSKNPEETTPQELLGINQMVLEKYYKSAISFLSDRKWENARDAFTFLTFLNPYVHEFWVGLGIAEQSQSCFDKALQAYTLAEATDPEDPIPIANSFQCILALGENEYAQYTLEKALKRCGEKEEFSSLKAQLLLQNVPR